MLEQFRKKEEGPDYNKLMSAISNDMLAYGPMEEEYIKLLGYMERLDALSRQKKSLLSRVSPDTMAIVLGNLAVVALIIMYEQKHVMSKNGLGMLLKTKTPPNV